MKLLSIIIVLSAFIYYFYKRDSNIIESNFQIDITYMSVLSSYELTTETRLSKFLSDHNYDVSDSDFITMDNNPVKYEEIKDVKLNNDTKINIDIINKYLTTEHFEISYETIYVENSELLAGTTNISIPGLNGEKYIEYSIVEVNGIETSKTEISSGVIKDSVNEVVEVGTRANASAVERPIQQPEITQPEPNQPKPSVPSSNCPNGSYKLPDGTEGCLG